MREAALRRRLRGDVRNLPDGHVEIRAVGPVEGLEQLLADVRGGPTGSRVDAIDTLAPDTTAVFDSFTIRH